MADGSPGPALYALVEGAQRCCAASSIGCAGHVTRDAGFRLSTETGRGAVRAAEQLGAGHRGDGRQFLRRLNLDELTGRARFRDRELFFSESLDMKRDRLTDKIQDFFTSLAHRYASGKIRNMRSVARRALLDDD